MNVTEYRDLAHLPVDKPFFGLMVGRTGSGKTQLALDFINKNLIRRTGPVWGKVVVLCPTAKLQDVWSGFPRTDIHTEPGDYAGILGGIMNYQESQERHLPVLIVLDDVMGTLSGREGSEFTRIFTQIITGGRHRGLSVLCLVQSLKDRFFSSPLVRDNLAWSVCGKIRDTSRDKFVEMICGKDKDKGHRIVEACWSVPYRFCLSSDGDSGADISFVKCDPSRTPKVSIRYRK